MSKKQPKLTPLFPPSVYPERVGIYQHEFFGDCQKYFSYWNGDFWLANAWALDDAAEKTAKSNSAYGPDFAGWRGLAVKP